MEYNIIATQAKDFLKPTAKNDDTAVPVILEQQRDPQKNEEGTFLREAVLRNNFGVPQFFLERGAGVNGKSKWGETSLHFAAKNNDRKVAQFLLERGAEIDTSNKWGETPLHFAVRENSLEVAQLLLENGAEVNGKNQWGETPLHFAIRNNHFEASQLLLEHGAERDLRFGLPKVPYQASLSRQWKGSGILAFIKAGKTLLESWIQRSQGRRQLIEMKEYALKDIGTTQTEAKIEANKWFWQS